MNIPAVVLSEAHQTPMSDDEPTRPATEMSRLWSGAATQLAKRFVDCARIKQRCFDILDTEGAKRCFALSRELENLARVLNSLSDDFEPETAAAMRRQIIDRIMSVYETSERLLTLEPRATIVANGPTDCL